MPPGFFPGQSSELGTLGEVYVFSGLKLLPWRTGYLGDPCLPRRGAVRVPSGGILVRDHQFGGYFELTWAEVIPVAVRIFPISVLAASTHGQPSPSGSEEMSSEESSNLRPGSAAGCPGQPLEWAVLWKLKN